MSTPVELNEEQKRRHRGVIVAAVAAIFGDRVRIQQIEHVADPVTRAWIQKGRRAVHGSHNLTGIGRSMPDRRTETR
jgi:hypothetical protein